MNNVNVIGLGTMGHGIAQRMALAGRRIRGYDTASDARHSGRSRIRDHLEQLSTVGRTSRG